MTLYYSDRSRYESGQRCLRRRFWQYHYAGRGVEAVTGSLDLLFGSAIHWELERIMTGQPEGAKNAALADLLALVADQTTPDGHPASQEWLSLFQGLARTFADETKPTTLREYEWVASEVEITLELGDLRWMTRLDGVVRRRTDGMWFVVEAKTTSWMEKLLNESRTNFQLLMEAEAMRRHYNLAPEQVGGAMLLVFDKGYKSKVERDGETIGYRRVSPFTYWWRKDSADGTSEYLMKRPAKWSGWELTPVWTVPGWWEFARENWADQVRGQVQLWPTVSFDQKRVQSVIRQVEASELDAKDFQEHQQHHRTADMDDAQWSAINEEALDVWWPQNFLNCANDGGFGRECPFKDCCFTPQVGRDPIGSDLFEWRKPNHPQEVVASHDER